MQPLCISKDHCITEEKRKLIMWEGGGVGVCASGFDGLKIIFAGKDGGKERVPVLCSHRDKRISEWSGPALFLFDRERESTKRVLSKQRFGGELLTLTYQSTCTDSIYNKGKVQRHFLRWASESRESVREKLSINLMARFWIVSREAREYLEALLHRWEPYSRQGRIWAL